MKHARQAHRRSGQRGAALLIAMIILALVATLASAMVWQQWRAVQVESVERARTQSAWILTGANDYGRWVLNRDGSIVDSFADIWPTPIQETRISTFLATDTDNTDDAPDAFLSGAMVDAQSRYNLRNVVELNGQDLQDETARLVNLLDSIGVNGSYLGPLLVRTMRGAFPPTTLTSATATSSAASSGTTTTTATTTATSTSGTTTTGTTSAAATATPLTFVQPQTIAQLAWFGVDDDSITRMTPYLTILPYATKVNINTASKEVIAAVAGVNPGIAQQWIQYRNGKPFDNLVQTIPTLTPGLNAAQLTVIGNNLAINSSYFEVHGRLRLADRVLEESSIAKRDVATKLVTLIQRQRQSLRDLAN